MRAVVRLRARVPSEATTARGLGTEREGSGALVGNQGLVLIIGYSSACPEWAARPCNMFVPINLLKPILAVEQAPVSGVAAFYRRLWAAGTAGVTVRLRVLQGDWIRELSVRSADRHESLLRSSPRTRGGLTVALPRT